MTTCPSGVHYMHLVDHARTYIEQNYKRPLSDRALRWVLARILPYPYRFRAALAGAKLARPFARLIPDARLRAMLAMAPKTIPPVSRNDDPQTFAPVPNEAPGLRMVAYTVFRCSRARGQPDACNARQRGRSSYRQGRTGSGRCA